MDNGVTSPVKEGTDVRLRCETSARPTPHSYSWYHNVSSLFFLYPFPYCPILNRFRFIYFITVKEFCGPELCHTGNNFTFVPKYIYRLHWNFRLRLPKKKKKLAILLYVFASHLMDDDSTLENVINFHSLRIFLQVCSHYLTT